MTTIMEIVASHCITSFNCILNDATKRLNHTQSMIKPLKKTKIYPQDSENYMDLN